MQQGFRVELDGVTAAIEVSGESEGEIEEF